MGYRVAFTRLKIFDVFCFKVFSSGSLIRVKDGVVVGYGFRVRVSDRVSFRARGGLGFIYCRLNLLELKLCLTK